MKNTESEIALFLFNSSEYAVQPWLGAGIPCVSVDYDQTDHSGHVGRTGATSEGHARLSIDLSQEGAAFAVARALKSQGLRPRFVLSFTPCTDLAVSGAAHFAKKRAKNPNFQLEALRMAQVAETVADFFGARWAVENPVSVLSTLWRKPDYLFHPWQFAGYCPTGEHPEAPTLYPPQDRYNKKTCLWTGGGFKFPALAPLAPLEHQNVGHTKLGGKSAKTKHLRSLTPRGVAQALFVANRDAFKVTRNSLLAILR